LYGTVFVPPDLTATGETTVSTGTAEPNNGRLLNAKTEAKSQEKSAQNFIIHLTIMGIVLGDAKRQNLDVIFLQQVVLAGQKRPRGSECNGDSRQL
jgi:hypothetical protein